ncbi:hypothetical protein BT63DRAFT_467252 [Microthyrium microscopicum]|uniref:MARVEL domain-containing protein n=1 Tax=Microthyrium microscopicum TaxID=703497 RepID=A0A6A6URW4_9PEZI|nr:hypothetical protein BT63DRAFT_467252 [Microthyrium microscopicum]
MPAILKTVSLLLRALELIFAVIIIALSGRMISTSVWNAVPRRLGGNAAEVNFAMFLGVFALVTTLLLGPLTFRLPRAGLALYAIAGLDLLNMCLNLGGGIGLAAAMDIHSCDNRRYTRYNRITNSSADTRARCMEAQGTTAFIWLNFLAFALSFGLSIQSILVRHEDSAVSNPEMASNTSRHNHGSNGPILDPPSSRSNRLRVPVPGFGKSKNTPTASNTQPNISETRPIPVRTSTENITALPQIHQPVPTRPQSHGHFTEEFNRNDTGENYGHTVPVAPPAPPVSDQIEHADGSGSRKIVLNG